MKSITISGDLGSGKSIVAKALAGILNCSYLSTGTIQRGIAAEMNMSTLELNKYSETHPEIDERIDSIFAGLDKSGECYIVDSRMAWHFLKSAVKVHLVVDAQIAAQRIMADQTRNHVEKYASIEQAKADILSRKKSENVRFLEKYQADCSALGNYDIIVETSIAKPEEVTDCILRCYRKYQGSEKRFFVSPRSLLPGRVSEREGAQAVLGSMTENGFDQSRPVEVVSLDGFYYIWDGHKRVSGALRHGIPLIPIKVLASDDEEIKEGLSLRTHISRAVSPSLISSWEECHGFTFYKHPGL